MPGQYYPERPDLEPYLHEDRPPGHAASEIMQGDEQIQIDVNWALVDSPDSAGVLLPGPDGRDVADALWEACQLMVQRILGCHL